MDMLSEPSGRDSDIGPDFKGDVSSGDTEDVTGQDKPKTLGQIIDQALAKDERVHPSTARVDIVAKMLNAYFGSRRSDRSGPKSVHIVQAALGKAALKQPIAGKLTQEAALALPIDPSDLEAFQERVGEQVRRSVFPPRPR